MSKMFLGYRQIYLLIALFTDYPENWVECEVRMFLLIFIICLFSTFLFGALFSLGMDFGRIMWAKHKLRKLQNEIESRVSEV